MSRSVRKTNRSAISCVNSSLSFILYPPVSTCLMLCEAVISKRKWTCALSIQAAKTFKQTTVMFFCDDYFAPDVDESSHNEAILYKTTAGLLYLSLVFYFPILFSQFNPPPLPLHHFSHLRLTPPHSLRCLRSDSYVLVERGLLLICAEWEKAVLAWGGEKLV